MTQLVSPSEEPRFFDDVGCLATFLKSGGAPAKGQIAYVADHRSAEGRPPGPLTDHRS